MTASPSVLRQSLQVSRLHIMLYPSLLLSFAINSVTAIAAGPTVQRNVCTVQSAGSNETDDAPAILEAFGQCGKDATIVFQPTTYYVNSVMNVTWLKNVNVDIQGTLSVTILFSSWSRPAMH